MKPILIALFSLLSLNAIFAQQYTVNGNASQTDCHSYILTRNINTQSGSVWNNIKIDLTQSFNFTFDVYLGDPEMAPIDGADGIAFVLQPISTSIGGNGSGLGFGGINPSIGITLDTYQNSSPDFDPSYDHIAIQKNGDLLHTSINNLAGPVTIINGNNNAEDGNWHTFKIVWNAITKTLDAYIDGSLRVSRTEDFVTTTFSGNPLVFWGFTGSTGGLNNWQKFKTSLSPQWNFPAAQKRCVNEPITFQNTTIAFAPIIKTYWDFGDGSNIDSVNTNPTHTYTVAGDYTITQRVKGADGCEETNTQTVRVGSKPTAYFTFDDNCAGNTIHFQDSSYTTVGNLSTFYWDFGNGLTSTASTATITYPAGGDTIIKHVVTTAQGCVSDTFVKVFHIYTRPMVDFTFTDSVCLGQPTSFFGLVTSSTDPITNWLWNFGDNNPIGTQNATHTFLTAGINGALFAATSNGSAGCLGIISKPVFVVDKPIAHFTHDIICQSVTTSFTDSSYTSDGLPINEWTWDLGNGTITHNQNPSTIYTNAGADTVILFVSSGNNCRSDAIIVPVFVNAKPTANFGIDALVCSGTPIKFSDSSLTANGIINTWSWIYTGNQWSTEQNPSGLFTAGPQTISLSVASSAGCRSDTISKPFLVNPKPAVAMNFGDECKFTPVNFTGSVVTGNINEWYWSFGDAGIANTQNAVHTYNGNGTYNVQLFGLDQLGCSSDTLRKNIIIYGTNAFAGNDTIAAAGQPVQLNAVGGLSYTWTPSTGLNNSTIANPVAIIQSTQTYTVKAFTPEGCESYDDITIKIYKGPDIYLPTAFTPNDDGLNDVFRGIPVGLKEFKYLKVFNRWGQEVFSSTDYRKGWDGKWKAAPQSSGVFVVIANGIDFTGKVINKKSTVMLIR